MRVGKECPKSDGVLPVIVIDAISARQGGGQTYLFNLLEYFPENAKVRVLVLALPGWDVKVSRTNVKVQFVRSWLINPLVRALWQRYKLPGILRELGASVVFVPGGVSSLRPLTDCKLVTMSRNMIPFNITARRRYPFGWQRVRNWLLRRTMESSFMSADLVIFLSQYAFNTITAVIRKPIRASLIIPHGVNDAFFSEVADVKSKLPAGLQSNHYLLYVSSIDFYKAQCEVVEAFSEYLEATSSNQKLLLVGPANKRYLKKVYRTIKKLKLDDRVIIHGAFPYGKIPILYREAKAIVFASEVENCPNILLEAMATGRPVFCSSSQPMPEFGGEAVIYFEPRSPSDLADKLITILADQQACLKWANRARARGKSYQLHESATKTWSVLFSLLPNKDYG
jgi:glycosyltransferase involved in cell wall biosynthesis